MRGVRLRCCAPLRTALPCGRRSPWAHVAAVPGLLISTVAVPAQKQVEQRGDENGIITVSHLFGPARAALLVILVVGTLTPGVAPPWNRDPGHSSSRRTRQRKRNKSNPKKSRPRNRIGTAPLHQGGHGGRYARHAALDPRISRPHRRDPSGRPAEPGTALHL